MALTKYQVLVLLLCPLASSATMKVCPDDPTLDLCCEYANPDTVMVEKEWPPCPGQINETLLEEEAEEEEEIEEIDTLPTETQKPKEASSTVRQSASGRLLAILLVVLSTKVNSAYLFLPLTVLVFAVGADSPILPAPPGSTTPTCDAVKEAYKSSGCCAANDTVTREVPMDIYREGCNTIVATSTATGAITGGTLYVYDATAGNKQWKTFADGRKFVDLAQSSIDAGCVPKHKPHMVLPSPDGKYTAVTYTGDQGFSIIRNDEYAVRYCPSVEFLKPSVFGGAAHAGAWHTKGTFLLVDMTGCVNGICGGAVYKFALQYDARGVMTGYEYKSALGHGGVKEARKTDGTKPIAMGNNPKGNHSHLFYVTDAKGAGSIMNADTMTWEKHFDVSEFNNCGAGRGGLWVEPHPDDPAMVLAQYGQQGTMDSPGYNCLFKIDMKKLTISKLVDLRQNVDAHGMQFCFSSLQNLTVLNTNRQDATLDVIKYSDGSKLLEGYKLNANVFDKKTATFVKDPSAKGGTEDLVQNKTDKLQPDIVFLHDDILFMAARGPKPVSAVKAENYFKNAHPGVMALKINKTTCQPAADQSEAFILTTMERSPEITSDVHSLWRVKNGDKNEIWVVDQAGTGSVQTYFVYSECAAVGVEADQIHADPPAALP